MMNDSLQQRLENFRMLFAHAVDAHFLFRETMFIEANDAFRSMLGCETLEESLMISPADISPELQPDGTSSFEQVKEVVRQTIEQGHAQFEWVHRRINGELFPVEVSLNRVDVPDGNPIIYGFWKDISDRKAMQQAMVDSEARYRSLIENMQDAMFVIQQSVLVFVNHVFANLVGYAPDELIGQNFAKYIAPEDREMVLNRYTRRMAGEDVPNNYEFRLLHSDGKTRIWVNMAVALVDYEGQPSSMGTLQDITTHKESEQDLRLFRSMVENSPDGFAISTMDGTIVYVNPAHKALFGFGERVLSMNVQDFFPPEIKNRMTEVMQTIAQKGSWQGEFPHLCHDGSTIESLVTCFLIQNAQGIPTHTAAIVRDIRARKQEEEDRAALQLQVIEAQSAALRELSSPLIPLSEHVVLMPLIGSIDSQRAQLVMETLLEGVALHQADIAILDITGVSVVDTQVANALVQAAQAVKLLGAQVVLTGIGSTMAQTLVHLGADLSSIVTRGSLQNGIAYALRR